MLALVLAPAAIAHSVLIATEPSDDAVVEHSPERVLLRFDEPVEAALGSVRVYDTSAGEVDSGALSKPASNEVAVAVERELPRGTYTVVWRVISADSDPIRGAFVFHVGAPGAQPKGIAAEVLRDTPLLVSVLYAGGRFVEFALLLLCAGGIAVLAVALRSAGVPLRGRLYRLVAAAAAVLAVAALAGIVLQGAAAGGFGLAEAAGWEVVSAVLETRYGEFALLRAALAGTLAAVALVLARRGTKSPFGIAAAFGLALAVLVTPSLSGHPSVVGPLAVFVDAAHVAAAAVWTGGLAFVVLALVLAGDDRWPLAGRAVPRFSTLAVLSVAVVILAGAANAYFQVHTWGGLTTTYGLILLAKAALAAPLLALGAYNNRYAVPRLRAGIASPGERRRFLQAATGELTIVVAIVAVTAVLVNAPPARTAAEGHGPAAAVADLGELEAHVSVEPARAGRNSIRLMFAGHGGDPARLEGVDVSAMLVSEGVGPLRFSARPGEEAGEFVVVDANLPMAGSWQLRIEARRGEFELLTQTVSIPIREE